MNQKGSASRGELTKAMGATIQTVRKHEMQIAAILEGIKQLMDGQTALGEAVDELKAKVRTDEDIMREAAEDLIEASRLG